MKKILLFIGIAIFVCPVLFAQTPQYIPYQAVARNSAGNLLQTQSVGLRFTIRETSASGTIDYQETQTTTTNSLGLFAVNIGSGTVVSGTFAGIPWGNGVAKYTQVEIDPTGGTSYTSLGAAQMMSVPYALYAGTANAAAGTHTNGSGLTGGAYNGSSAITWAVQSLNGLNTNSTDNAVELGGTLTKSTTITQAGFNMIHNLTGTGDFEIEENGNPSLYILGDHGTTSDGNIGIGTAVIPKGGIGYAKFAIDGASGSANGPHVQYTTAADNYPVFQQLNWSHDNQALSFDAYYDGTAWRAGSTSAAFQLYKISGALNFNYAAATTQGASINFTSALSISSSGLLKASSLAGTGYRPVYADASGNLYTISGSSSNKATFAYSGSVASWTVPTGVNVVFAKIWGGGGGSGYSTGDGPGGAGGFVSGFISVTPGNKLYIVVGAGGPAGTNSSGVGSSAFGGGGKAGQAYSGGGGGYSGIFSSSTISQANALAIAGGGGGGGKNSIGFSGGGGGGLVGAGGCENNAIYNSGTGGTQIAGGVTLTNGGAPNYTSSFQGGALSGGNGSTGAQGSPGGGGGWYGGGAGGISGSDGGAGGGSSYISGFVPYMPIRNEQGMTAQTYLKGYTLNINNVLQPGGTDGTDYVSGVGLGGYTVSSGSAGNAGGNGYVVIYY